MPEPQTLITIGLIVLVIFQYVEPIKSHDLLEPILGKAIDWVKGLFKSTPTTNDSGCPTESVPVCANNKTYTNSCLAIKDGKNQFTMGACI